jgi:hypothetical protein
VTNSLSSLIRFRILSIPFGRLKIENYGSSAPLEVCYITATCQVRRSHIYALQSLSNRTRLSNKRESMEVYRLSPFLLLQDACGFPFKLSVRILTFLEPCIAIYFYIKTNWMHNISVLFCFYFGPALYMFPTVFPSIIRSLKQYTQHQAYVIQVQPTAC